MRILGRPSTIHLLTDAIIIAASFFISLALRTTESGHLQVLIHLFPLFTVIRLGIMIAFGSYTIIWRYISLEDVMKLGRAIAVSTAFIISVTYMVDIGTLPRSMFLIDALLVSLALVGVRIARRMVHKYKQEPTHCLGHRKTLIIGAGDTGRIFAQKVSNEPQLGMQIVGFVDDDPKKAHRTLAGHQILGKMESIEKLVNHFDVQDIVVAIQKPAGHILRRLVLLSKKLDVSLKLVASLDAHFGNRADLLRPIDPQDLINRPFHPMETQPIEELLFGKRVLVTGAGGSIGSELSRQILQCKPDRLILLDHSEFNLYNIDQELRSQGNANCLVPTLGDIKDKVLLEEVMRRHEPQIIFHAAAYKHVPLVESNPFISIINNIQGTQNLLDLAESYDVSKFVLISSDKAVNPVGVMGATKRVCEMLVSSAAAKTGRAYSSVRFGNVIGSSGSLVPLLEKRIRNGEPVTLTHPEMKRYFMTGAEAVSLVLKSVTLSEPGDIVIFKMGDPVFIVEIAKSLIALMGKTEVDVPIVFSGIRPGEKMFEELYLSGREVNTQHPDILIVPKGDQSLRLPRDILLSQVNSMIALSKEGKKEAIKGLYALATPELNTTVSTLSEAH